MPIIFLAIIIAAIIAAPHIRCWLWRYIIRRDMFALYKDSHRK